jgi:ATP-binding cassette subfamily F protein 3
VREEVSLAFAELLALKDEQHRIEDALAGTSHDDGGDHERLLERYAEVTDRFKHLGGYEMDASIADVLKGLGFAPADQDRATDEFSGGWQMRIALSKLLLARPNLLLMDEPTNHLDLPARNWLEEYLQAYPGSVVLVSHDRYFLDATVKRITEVGLRTLTDYHGNYSRYVVEHAARMDRLRESHRRQQEEIEKASAFINKFRYQATKARQVQSRIKLLDKIERIEIPPERKRIRFKFPDAPRPGRVVLELKEARRAYGEHVVLDQVALIVERGDRIALVGPNGAGKSTLMRILAGVDRPDSGVRLTGHQVVLDYFAQDQADVLDPARTVHEEMAASSPTTMVPMIRNILGGFLFSGDDVYKRVGVLSGGERNRLALAKMLLRPSNVLLLDEPTNHLDLESKEILLDALLDYGGTLVFVSHDRYFVDRLATKVIDVGDGRALPYPGGYEDFLHWKKQREAGVEAPMPTAARRPVVHLRPGAAGAAEADRHEAAPAKASRTGAAAKPAPAPAGASPSKARAPQQPNGNAGAKRGSPEPSYDPLAPRLRPAGAAPDRQAREREIRKLKARVAELERQVAEKEQAVKDLEQLMSSPGFYDQRSVADKAVAERQALLGEVASLMTEWESAQASLEELQGSAPSAARR